MLFIGQLFVVLCCKVLLVVVFGGFLIVVGMYVLLFDVVIFVELGFVVVDEQYCFGVDQCEVLWLKGMELFFFIVFGVGVGVVLVFYVFVMIVILIFCMVVMIVFGDLDVLIILELLFGWVLIELFVVFLVEYFGWEGWIWVWFSEELVKGCQVFVVCLVIDLKYVEDVDVDEVVVVGFVVGVVDVDVVVVIGVVVFFFVVVLMVVDQVCVNLLFVDCCIEVLYGCMLSDEKDVIM